LPVVRLRLFFAPSPGARGCSTAAVSRLQLYVDDPTLSCCGTQAECDTALDLVILWWSVLGLPLSLDKGLVTQGEHKWIGGLFSLRAGPKGWECVVRPPPKFLDELAVLLRRFSASRGHASQAEVDSLLGKAGRLAYLVPPRQALRIRALGRIRGSTAGQRLRPPRSPPEPIRNSTLQPCSPLASHAAFPSFGSDRASWIAPPRAIHQSMASENQ